ncbi:MAG: hypothetical protein AB7J32_04320 [Pseudonocardia sp.]
MIETGPRVAGLTAVVFVWAVAAAAVLGTAAFTRIGPVVFVFNERHGVHAFDALVAVAAFVVALLATAVLLRRPAHSPEPPARHGGRLPDVVVPRAVAWGPVEPRGWPGHPHMRATLPLPAPRPPVDVRGGPGRPAVQAAVPDPRHHPWRAPGAGAPRGWPPRIPVDVPTVVLATAGRVR